MSRTRKVVRWILLVATFISIFIASYVWFFMCLVALFLLDDRGPEHLLRSGTDVGCSLVLDTICLLLLFAGVFQKLAPSRVFVIGLGMATASFTLRVVEFLAPDAHMWWFEPWLRSGIYLLSFVLLYSLETARKSPGTSLPATIATDSRNNNSI